jgi:hypothetical protein
MEPLASIFTSRYSMLLVVIEPVAFANGEGVTSEVAEHAAIEIVSRGKRFIAFVIV